MSDERVCYAGDLSTDVIGKMIRVTVKRDHMTSIIEDVVVAVLHQSSRRAAEPDRSWSSAEIAEEKQTTIFFKNTQWRPFSLLGLTRDTGITVEDTRPVEVLP